MSEPHIHLDIPTQHATFTRQAIAVALDRAPETFDEEQTRKLHDVAELLAFAVDDTLRV